MALLSEYVYWGCLYYSFVFRFNLDMLNMHFERLKDVFKAVNKYNTLYVLQTPYRRAVLPGM